MARTSRSETITIDEHQVRRSSLDRVMYPEAGFTKADALDCCGGVVEPFLRHLRDRVVTQIRFPGGGVGRPDRLVTDLDPGEDAETDEVAPTHAVINSLVRCHALRDVTRRRWVEKPADRPMFGPVARRIVVDTSRGLPTRYRPRRCVMSSPDLIRPVSRRTALAGLGASGLTLAAAGAASAKQGASLADHPLTGVWLAMANPASPEDPQFPAPSYYGADGTVLLSFPVGQIGPNGAQLSSILMGTWEAHDEWTGHFTVVQLLSELDGTYAGSVTIDGFPKVNEDGASFIDDGSLAFVTIRDPAGNVLQTAPAVGSKPVTAVRMAPGAAGIPEPGATPTG